MIALAGRVAGHLPGARVVGSTLAAPGALEAALDGLSAPLVYPFFMASGWFTQTCLPRRLERCGRQELKIMSPLGLDPALQTLVLDAVLRATTDTRRTTLILAAHGSAVSRGSERATSRLADDLRATGVLASVTCGFIEESPSLVDVARDVQGTAICLPLFALTAGHVVQDIPDALAAASFTGPLLPPIGSHDGVPRLIADAARRQWRSAA